MLVLVTQQAGDAESSAKEARAAADEAREDGEQLRTFLVNLVAAIKPDSLTAKEAKKMADEFRPFAKRGVPIKLIFVEGPPQSLAIWIAFALKYAGFSEPLIETRTALYPGIQMGAPTRPVEYWKLMEQIEGPIVKRFGIMGVLQPLPDGSPITIWIGPTLPGEIPKIPARKHHK